MFGKQSIMQCNMKIAPVDPGVGLWMQEHPNSSSPKVEPEDPHAISQLECERDNGLPEVGLFEDLLYCRGFTKKLVFGETDRCSGVAFRSSMNMICAGPL